LFHRFSRLLGEDLRPPRVASDRGDVLRKAVRERTVQIHSISRREESTRTIAATADGPWLWEMAFDDMVGPRRERRAPW